MASGNILFSALRGTSQHYPGRQGPSWQDHLRSGAPLTINFNRAAHTGDTPRYTGDINGNGDPMGTLLAGQRYSLRYDQRSNNFSVTGYNEGAGRVGTWSYNNADLDRNQISMWGRQYTLKPNASGELEVIDGQYGVVGTVEGYRTRPPCWPKGRSDWQREPSDRLEMTQLGRLQAWSQQYGQSLVAVATSSVYRTGQAPQGYYPEALARLLFS